MFYHSYCSLFKSSALKSFSSFVCRILERDVVAQFYGSVHEIVSGLQLVPVSLACFSLFSKTLAEGGLWIVAVETGLPVV